MTRLRPECEVAWDSAVVPNDRVLQLLYKAVARRRSLGFGTIYDEAGKSNCAMGAFWADNGPLTVNTGLVDEVAAVNDSVPPTASKKERWNTVMRWLRWKLEMTR